MNFLKQVADSTGATVNGSDRKVGSAEQGGSWELGRHAAPRPPFSSDAIAGFDGVLDHEHGLRIVSVATDIGDGTYAPNQPIVFTATMSEPVTAGSSMTLTLSNSDTVVVAASADGTVMTSSGYTVSGYAGTLVVTDVTDGDGGSNLVSPVTTGESYISFYPNDDFDNIVDSAMITIAGTTGANAPAVSASDISVQAEPGTLSIGDTITVTYDSAGAGQTVTDVTFDLMQFSGDPADSQLGYDNFDGSVYTITKTLTEGDIDGAYARAFVTVTSDDGSVSHVTADDESFFVDIDTPMVDDIDLQPGSDSGESSSDGITNADSLVFRVDFSEPVVGLGTSDFHANNGADVIGVVEVAAGDGEVIW